MSIISQFCQIPCKLQNPQLNLNPKSPIFLSLNLLKFYSSSSSIPSKSVNLSAAAPKRDQFEVRAAANDDEWGNDYDGSAVAVAGPPPMEDLVAIEINALKKQLVDSFYGTDRGLKARSETRDEIVELTTQLEAKNLTPAPTEALSLLNGKWILA